ncbi:uncharacterized protein LOC143881407 [Tasmannia lanceolata]|uniref:uncharacterized protein LOC143881407 n=1 Tax=Tasmannia lanceolata TaxID=3420 RepID=UPI004063089C
MNPSSDFMTKIEPTEKEDFSSKFSVKKPSISQDLEQNPLLNNEIQESCLVDGKFQIGFHPGRIQSSLHKRKNSLLGKMFCSQIPNLEYIKEKMLFIWDPRGDLSIKFLGNDFLFFTFEREDDFSHAFTGGPCYISQSQILILQRWNPEFNPFSDKIHKIPIWVWFPKLPMHLWEEYYLFSLANTIGKPLKMDDQSIEKGRARVCVEIDCLRPVLEGIWIGPKDSEKWQPFEYEILPKFCSVCDQLGHDVVNSSCPGVENSTLKTSHGFENQKRKQHVTCIEIESSDDDDDHGFGIVRSCKTSECRGISLGEDNQSNKTCPKGIATEIGNDQSHEAFPNETGKAVNGALGCEDNKEEDVKQSSRDGKEQAGKCKENGKERLVDRNFNYHEPEFHDFDKEREEIKFEVGQVWAVFDDRDCMPRYYVYVRKVFSSGFRVCINWLYPNPNPKNHDEIDWLDKGLPIACGNFKLGASEKTEKRLMFSHLVSREKDKARNGCKIYPRKGDIWAIFKDWSFKWSSEPDKHTQYEYEYVEVLSDYGEGTGVKIVRLVKVNGFLSLFLRKASKELNSVQVSSTELFRFSHRIPYYIMNGQEREDIPNGSFELDPASLPHIIEEKHGKTSSSDAVGSHNSSVAMCSGGINNYPEPEFHNFENANQGWADKGRNLESAKGSLDGFPDNKPAEASAPKCRIDKKNKYLDAAKAYSSDDIEGHNSIPSVSLVYGCPDPEFHNFERNIKKFQTGQIWAVYSDKDGLPKHYVRIRSVIARSKVIVHWLEACPLLKEEIRWSQNLPTACGIFSAAGTSTRQTLGIEALSHQVRAEPTSETRIYEIYPREGEVWALYKNWSPGGIVPDLDNCEYKMVEVLKETCFGLSVICLEKMEGYTSVFKQNGSRKEISRDELLKFSHQVPAFRLTKEKGGKLRGYFELDPASVPSVFFCTTTRK